VGLEAEGTTSSLTSKGAEHVLRLACLLLLAFCHCLDRHI
jgi:hypothetical protein